MKKPVEKRNARGLIDHLALAVTTFGVGYIPGAPGTYGSAVGVGIYCAVSYAWLWLLPGSDLARPEFVAAQVGAILIVGFVVFTIIGILAASRSVALLGDEDPSQAVIDEVLGQLITFCFVPFGIGWPLILGGFLLFRLFDIWKPYPIDDLQALSGGLGICADDIVAGVYAGTCLAAIYALSLSV